MDIVINIFYRNCKIKSVIFDDKGAFWKITDSVLDINEIRDIDKCKIPDNY
jgi:hypothetical protein